MKRLLITLFSSLFIATGFSAFFYHKLNELVSENFNPLRETVEFLDSDTTNYDAIFIGSSRIYFHVNPKIIDSICKLNTRCIAIDGATISEKYIILLKYIQHHPAPKLLFLGLDYTSLDGEHLPYDYPYYYAYMNDPVFDSIMSRVNKRFYYKGLFRFYDTFIRISARTDYQKYAVFSTLITPSKKFTDLSDEPSWQIGLKKYKGYSGLERKWQKESDLEMNITGKPNIDKLGVEFFDMFVKNAREYCPNTIILYTPIYGGFGRNFDTRSFFDQVNETAGKYNVPFWNYVGGKDWMNKKFFYNWGHLNLDGSTLFSYKLANDINNFMYGTHSDTLNGVRR